MKKGNTIELEVKMPRKWGSDWSCIWKLCSPKGKTMTWGLKSLNNERKRIVDELISTQFCKWGILITWASVELQKERRRDSKEHPPTGPNSAWGMWLWKQEHQPPEMTLMGDMILLDNQVVGDKANKKDEGKLWRREQDFAENRLCVPQGLERVEECIKLGKCLEPYWTQKH